MTYRVQHTVTRNGDAPFQTQDSSFIAGTDALMTENNITATRSIDGNVLTIVYEAPDQASWDAYYNAMIPRWQSIGAVDYINDNNIVMEMQVI
jgi:hypothetical protein